MSFKNLVAAVVLFLLPVLALAQDGEIPTHVNAQNRSGDMPYPSSVGTAMEHVDVASGALTVNIPLWSVPGRGLDRDLELGYHWNSNYFTTAQRIDANQSPYLIWRVLQYSGWRENSALMSVSYSTVSCDDPRYLPSSDFTQYATYIYHDKFGGLHSNAVQMAARLCTQPDVSPAPDLEAAGMMVTPDSVTEANGSVALGGQGPDPNGNYLNSLGRPLYTSTSTTTADGYPATTVYTVKDSDGNLQTITVIWEQIGITTNFHTSDDEAPGGGYMQDMSGWLMSVIKSITLTNGTSYKFFYEPDYGELTEIDLPTGGVIKYTWANVLAGTSTRRYVASRTEITDQGSSTWSFNVVPIVGATDGYTSTVTFPLVPTPTGPPVSSQSVFVSYYGAVTDAKLYQGSVGGVPLHEYAIRYDYDDDPFAADECYTEVFPRQPRNLRPTRIVTILEDGTTATKKEFDYGDSFPYTFYPNRCGDTAQNSIPKTFYANRGNVTAIREYGFGSYSSGDVSAQLLRTTTKTYLHNNLNSPYLAPNIVNKVLKEIVTDNVANLTASQTTYGYDDPASMISTPNLATVPGHDPSYTSSYLLRGNVTSVGKWNNADGTSLTTKYAYDDLGNLRTVTDPKGKTTSWLYDDKFATIATCAPSANSYAYVSQKIDTVGNNFYVTRYACTGQVQSHRDDNDVSRLGTVYTYDAMRRLKDTTFPDGGSVKNIYVDVAPPYITTTTKALPPDADIIEDKYFDGLNRLKQTQVHDPQGNDIVDTKYDALGRVWKVSNPYRGTATDFVTTVYDALSRPLLVTKQDSGTVSYNYSRNKTTVTDETTRQHSTYTDALGRLIQVDEEATHQAGSPAAPGWGTVTIFRNRT